MTEMPPTPPAPQMSEPEPQPPKQRFSRRALIIAGVAAVVVIAAIVVPLVTLGGGSNKITVNGTMTLIDSDSAAAWATAGTTTCSGTGGYSDLVAGANVVITDDSGKTLAITGLGPGDTGSADDPAGRCKFTFTASVPAGKKFYGIAISHRGTVKMPESEMSAPDLTIGS